MITKGQLKAEAKAQTPAKQLYSVAAWAALTVSPFRIQQTVVATEPE